MRNLLATKTLFDKRVDVPCNGCTACCRSGEFIPLHPQLGDRVEDYETYEAVNPMTGERVHAVKKKADGSCVYLGESGCTIHDRAPRICQEFDCRRFYRSIMRQTSRAERRYFLKTPVLSKEVLAAGKARLNTLPDRWIGHIQQQDEKRIPR